MRLRNLIVLFVVLFFLLSIGFFVFYRQVLMSRGSSLSSWAEVSEENSYVFVSPLRAKADGEERIRVNIFILDKRGLGIGGLKVSLSSNPALVVEAKQSVTDPYGKAIFDVSSQSAGEYYLDIHVEGKKMKNKVHLVFY